MKEMGNANFKIQLEYQDSKSSTESNMNRDSETIDHFSFLDSIQINFQRLCQHSVSFKEKYFPSDYRLAKESIWVKMQHTFPYCFVLPFTKPISKCAS